MAIYSDGDPPKGSMKKSRFRPISRFISEMIQDRNIVAMERQQELICDLSNGAISNDLV